MRVEYIGANNLIESAWELLKTIGALSGLATALFTLFDRFLRFQPLVSVTAQLGLTSSNATPLLRIRNVAPFDILVEKIEIEPTLIGLSQQQTIRAMVDVLTGDRITVLLGPSDEQLLYIILLDPSPRHLDASTRIKITVWWRRSETLWLRPAPTWIHTSLVDIDERTRAAVRAGRRIE
jgi:hypothetical protein